MCWVNDWKIPWPHQNRGTYRNDCVKISLTDFSVIPSHLADLNIIRAHLKWIQLKQKSPWDPHQQVDLGWSTVPPSRGSIPKSSVPTTTILQRQGQEKHTWTYWSPRRQTRTALSEHAMLGGIAYISRIKMSNHRNILAFSPLSRSHLHSLFSTSASGNYPLLRRKHCESMKKAHNFYSPICPSDGIFRTNYVWLKLKVKMIYADCVDAASDARMSNFHAWDAPKRPSSSVSSVHLIWKIPIISRRCI